MSLVADKVDFEKCEIYDARLCNRESRNGLIFTDKALEDIARVGEGKPVMLDEHFQVGFSPNVGVVLGLRFENQSVSCERVRLKKSHAETANILETASDEDFSKTGGFSVEIMPGKFDSYLDKKTGKQIVTEVEEIVHFVLATHTGNTNGIRETDNRVKDSQPPEDEMSKIETVGDMRTAYPKLVGDVELAAKAEAEKSINEELTKLKADLEAAQKELIAEQTKVAVFEKEKTEAEEAEKLVQAETDIEQELVGCGCCEKVIAENNNMIKKLAKLGDKELTDNFIAGMTSRKKGSGLRDSLDDGIAETLSRKEIIARRRKAITG